MFHDSFYGMLRPSAKGMIYTPKQEYLPYSDESSPGKHQRSRSGCFTCRLRRKKCGEGKPVCQACKHFKLRCYYHKPPWWESAFCQAEQRRIIKEFIRISRLSVTPNKGIGPVQQKQLPQVVYQPSGPYYTAPTVPSQHPHYPHVLPLGGHIRWGYGVNQYPSTNLANHYPLPASAVALHNPASQSNFMANGYTMFQPSNLQENGMNVPFDNQNGNMAKPLGIDNIANQWCNQIQDRRTTRYDAQFQFPVGQSGTFSQEDAQLFTTKEYEQLFDGDGIDSSERSSLSSKAIVTPPSDPAPVQPLLGSASVLEQPTPGGSGTNQAFEYPVDPAAPHTQSQYQYPLAARIDQNKTPNISNNDEPPVWTVGAPKGHTSRDCAPVVTEMVDSQFVTDPIVQTLPGVEVSEQQSSMLDNVTELLPSLQTFLDGIGAHLLPIFGANHHAFLRSKLMEDAFNSNECFKHCTSVAMAVYAKSTNPAHHGQLDRDILNYRARAVEALFRIDSDGTNDLDHLQALMGAILLECRVSGEDQILPTPWQLNTKKAMKLVENIEAASRFVDWEDHFDMPVLKFNLSLAMWFDIIGATILRKVPLHARTYRAKYKACKPSGLQMLMGCDDRVMYILSEAACLDSLYSEGKVTAEQLSAHVADLDKSISVLDDESAPAESPYDNDGSLNLNQLMINITSIFRVALRIYIHSLTPAFEYDRRIASDLNTKLALELLPCIPAGPTGYDLAIQWPLLICGSYASRDSFLRPILYQRFAALGPPGLRGSFPKMMKVLENVWSIADAEEAHLREYCRCSLQALVNPSPFPSLMYIYGNVLGNEFTEIISLCNGFVYLQYILRHRDVLMYYTCRTLVLSQGLLRLNCRTGSYRLGPPSLVRRFDTGQDFELLQRLHIDIIYDIFVIIFITTLVKAMSRNSRRRDGLKYDLPSRALKARESANRRVNLYDAIAGRASIEGFRGLKNPFDVVNTNNPLARSTTSVPPEDVLFRRLNAPTRYEEDDYYFANEKLPSDVVLPDSDLLKAIHTYVSDFYACMVPNGDRISLHSMDHTALLAFGILLEETATTALGETGDMVFVEGVEEVSDQDEAVHLQSRAASAGRKRAPSISGWRQDEELLRYEKLRPGVPTRRKRRKVMK